MSPAPYGLTALQTLVVDRQARHILDLTSDSGSVVFGLAPLLPPDEGRLIRLEPSAEAAARLRAQLGDAGLAACVTVIAGTPARYLHKLAGPFDLVVMDAGPSGDVPALPGRLRPLLHPQGVVATLALRTPDLPHPDARSTTHE